MGAKLFHAGGRLDRHDEAFTVFLNAHKNMKINTEPSFCGMYRAENGISD